MVLLHSSIRCSEGAIVLKLRILACVLALLLLCGCAQKIERPVVVNQSQTVQDVLDQAGQTPTETTRAAAPDALPEVPSADGLDIDLTKMNSTMVYSQVFDIVTQPEAYEGKTIRMAGNFVMTEGMDRNYYACLIEDALGCCAQGIEFTWKGEHSYPADYPAEGGYITVTGTFEIYREGDLEYFQVADADLVF